MYTSPSGLTKRTTPDCFLACLDCAKSKAKCEKKFPCERCVRRKIQCRVRLTQRGPGRSSGYRAGRRQSPTKSTEISNRDSTESVSLGHQKSMKLETQSIVDPHINCGGVCSHPGCKTNPYIDVFLPRDSQLDIQHLDDIQYLYSSDASKEDQTLNLSLDTFLHESYFELPDLNEFSAPTHIDKQHDLFDLSLSSGSSSSYILTPEPFSSTTETKFFKVDTQGPCPGFVGFSETSGCQFPGLDGWPLFQCNPILSSSSCPETARNHIKTMYSALNSQQDLLNDYHPPDQRVAMEQLLEGTRDRLNATMQKFSNKAQKIHGLINFNKDNKSEPHESFYLILPAPGVLEAMLVDCINSYQQYYPFITAASLQPNELLESGTNATISSLKLALVLTAGAMNPGTRRTYRLAHGLLEICRISLSRLLSEHTKFLMAPEVLQCILLFTIVGVWSGDKWQMDTAIYQKGMYVEMIRRMGLLNQANLQYPTNGPLPQLEKSWKIWKEQEARNRLVYSWFVLDQEMCLFQDLPSTLFTSATDLNAAVPSLDIIWHASSAEKWAQEIGHLGGGTFSPSLKDYIKRFRETENVQDLRDLSPTVLRLLLSYIQILVIQIRENIADTCHGGKSFKAVLVSVRLDEARDLLQKWYALVQSKTSDETTPTIRAATAVYHLVVLNTLVSFPDIELLARGESSMQSVETYNSKGPHHLEETQHIYFHCGQILGIIRSISEHERPPWWAGAVYRVALISWANSMSCHEASWLPTEHSRRKVQIIVLDSLLADHPSVEGYLNKKEGIPVFSDDNGATVSLEIPGLVLTHCADFLGLDPQTNFIKGLRLKLLRLVERWKEIGSR